MKGPCLRCRRQTTAGICRLCVEQDNRETLAKHFFEAAKKELANYAGEQEFESEIEAMKQESKLVGRLMLSACSSFNTLTDRGRSNMAFFRQSVTSLRTAKMLVEHMLDEHLAKARDEAARLSGVRVLDGGLPLRREAT